MTSDPTWASPASNLWITHRRCSLFQVLRWAASGGIIANALGQERLASKKKAGFLKPFPSRLDYKTSTHFPLCLDLSVMEHGLQYFETIRGAGGKMALDLERCQSP